VKDQRQAGVTMVELMVVVVLIGVFSAASAPKVQQWFATQRLREATRSLADLVSLARTEAIRNRENYLVFFGQDAGGNPLPADGTGAPYAAAAIEDSNQNGQIDAGETVIGVPGVNGVAWGAGAAAAAAPDDSGLVANYVGGFTFRDDQTPANAAQWVVFGPDGLPIPFSVAPYSERTFGNGGGAVYLNNGTRDYAMVVSVLGAVRVNGWDGSQAAWR